jgi:hypothetical protein
MMEWRNLMVVGLVKGGFDRCGVAHFNHFEGFIDGRQHLTRCTPGGLF